MLSELFKIFSEKQGDSFFQRHVTFGSKGSVAFITDYFKNETDRKMFCHLP